MLNPTDPWNEVDGERASVKSKHPAFTDKAVRDAMNLLIDRKGIAGRHLRPRAPSPRPTS